MPQQLYCVSFHLGNQPSLAPICLCIRVLVLETESRLKVAGFLLSSISGSEGSAGAEQALSKRLMNEYILKTIEWLMLVLGTFVLFKHKEINWISFSLIIASGGAGRVSASAAIC